MSIGEPKMPLADEETTVKADKSIANIETIDDINETMGSVELKKGIPVAENIAKFRIELERKIFNEGLPRSEWQETYQEILNKYPEILAYKSIFDLALNKIEIANDSVNIFWEKEQVQKSTHGESVKNDTLQVNNLLKKADLESARHMFSVIFGILPKDEIEAFKGTISLRFIVNRRDFDSVVPAIEGETFAAAVEISGYDFQIILQRADLTESQGEEGVVSIVHEAQHIKNRFLNKTRQPNILEKLPLPEELSNVLIRREEKNDRVDKSIKDELLAYATFLLFYAKAGQSQDTSIRENFSTMAEGVSDTKGPYLGVYLQNKSDLKPGESDLAYSTRAKLGVKSIEDLYFFYRDIQRTTDSAELVINMLDQFPLKSWPAIVRLIKSRYSS